MDGGIGAGSDALNRCVRNHGKLRVHKRHRYRDVDPVVQSISEERGGLINLGVHERVGPNNILLDERVRRALRVLKYTRETAQVDPIERAEAEVLEAESREKLFLADGFGALRQNRAVTLRRSRVDPQCGIECVCESRGRRGQRQRRELAPYGAVKGTEIGLEIAVEMRQVIGVRQR